MNKYLLLDSVGGIDGRFVANADKKPKKQVVWRVAVSLAACLVLLIGVWFAYPQLFSTPDSDLEGRGTLSENMEDLTEPAIDPNQNDERPAYAIGEAFDDQAFLTGKPMLSGFDVVSENAKPVLKNGSVYYSDALSTALAEKGDSVFYRIYMDIYRDESPVSFGSEWMTMEAERLSGLGYHVAIETYTVEGDDGEYSWVAKSYYFTIHATYEQLMEFPANESFAYVIMFYDEYFGK